MTGRLTVGRAVSTRPEEGCGTLARARRHQQTIAQPVFVEGFGFWSGRNVQLEFRPAAPDTGIVFIRHDLQDPVRIPAHVDYRIEAPRRTALSHQGVQVEMIEHVMAALAGLRIDNCEVWVDAAEMPGCDGSSQPFVEALDRVARVSQPAPRDVLIITETMRVGNENCWIEARPTPYTHCSVQYLLDFGPQSSIGRETRRADVTPQTFRDELAPARTFIQRTEAEWLRQQGLAQRVTPRDVLVFDEQAGVIDNELRFQDECVRHKILDVIGDLALAGCDLVGHFIAHRSGHRLNALLVQSLLKEFQMEYVGRAIA